MGTEADTCRTYVVPRLYAAGWTDEQIREQIPVTDGRIMVMGQQARRGKSKRPDYLLRYKRDYTLASVLTTSKPSVIETNTEYTEYAA